MSEKRKVIILVSDSKDLKASFDVYKKLVNSCAEILIVKNDNICVSDESYSVRSFQDYQGLFHSNYPALLKDAYDLFYSLGKRELRGNKPLREFTIYRGVSLWDVSVFSVFSELLPILHDFNMLETILDFEKPSDVYVIKDVNKLEKMMVLICKKKNINFYIRAKSEKKLLKIEKLFLETLFFLKKIKRFLRGLYFLTGNFIKSKKLNNKYKIIFFASVNRYLDSILPILDKYNSQERLVVNVFSCASKRLKKLKVPYVEFCGFKPYGFFDNESRSFIRKIKDEIGANGILFKGLSYKGVEIDSLLVDFFEKLVREIFVDELQKIDVIRKIILHYQPKAIVVINYDANIVLVAKTLHVPCIGISNGFVGEFCNYGPFIFDAVTVDGSYWKDYLLKRQDIDQDGINITGPVRFDAVSKKRNSDKKLSALISGVPKKIVVFTSTYVDLPMSMAEYDRIQEIESICRAMKGIKDAHLVIKLHACEKDRRSYKKIAKEAGLSNYTILQNVDMLELICYSDLIIMHISTAGYEAVLLDKNVITLHGSSNYEKEDIWNFRKYNAVLGIDDLKDLEKSIRKVLFDPETIDRLKKGREEYIKEHAYKLDGKASDRVKQVIDRFVSK